MRCCWRSIDPGRNRYRFYVLEVREDLWGEPCLVRRWGRIGGGARELHTWIHHESELKRVMRSIMLARERHGGWLCSDINSTLLD